MRLEDLPDRYQKQAESQISQEDDNALSGSVSRQEEEPISRHQQGLERDLQRICESWLVHRGYLRLTPDNVCRVAEQDIDVKGWFSHYFNNKKNPLSPDLTIQDKLNRKAPLLVELKVANKYQPGQRECIGMGFWIEVREFEEFEKQVTAWEVEG